MSVVGACGRLSNSIRTLVLMAESDNISTTVISYVWTLSSFLEPGRYEAPKTDHGAFLCLSVSQPSLAKTPVSFAKIIY